VRLPSRALVAAIACTVACGGSGAPSTPSPPPAAPPAAPASFAFTSAPVDPSRLQEIVPLGTMNPWGHTLPTDHLYLVLQGGTAAIAAPAAGTIEAVIDRGGDAKITVRAAGGFVYGIDHVVLQSAFTSGAAVQAGQPLGTSTSGVFDLSLANLTRPLPFLNPARYSRDTLYADGPLHYFDEPIRSALYAKVRRAGGDRDGRIDYDEPGTLAGNWFDENLATERSSLGGDMSVGTRQLSFARDVYAPDRLRISIGGLGMTGLWAVQPDAPDFASITPASGLVVYRLFSTGEPGGPQGTQPIGSLIVQLTDGTHLKVEAIATAGTAFSPNARTYVR